MSAAALMLPAPLMAQEHEGMDHSQMDHGTMDHAAMGHDMMGNASNHDEPPVSGNLPPFSLGSGTSRLPGAEGAMHGLHLMTGDWMLMAHGFVTAHYTDHKGPRGDDMFYSTSMLMATAERDFGGAKLTLKSMMSLEPTLSARGYPNLFATGETADGVPLVDRQHPHDLFMELAARLDVDVAPGARVFVYGGPVGEPALGPSAFMMRGSARYNPEPPIAHHWFDATHITYGVVTAGVSTARWQLESSAFRGREPDEDRWDIEKPKLDSWSVRLSWTPTPRWAAQVSHGFLKEPEGMHAGQDEHRTTASVHYADGRVSAMAGFSAKNRDPGETLTAWLGEITWDITDHHSLFGRVENVANDELFPDHDDPLHEQRFRMTKAQGGYAYRMKLVGPLHLAVGGSVNAYAKPAALDAAYGRNPWGYSLFAKLMLGS
ncbi:MAG TPA: hypothetical protein VF475_15945 [Sphingobium sp.]